MTILDNLIPVDNPLLEKYIHCWICSFCYIFCARIFYLINSVINNAINPPHNPPNRAGLIL